MSRLQINFETPQPTAVKRYISNDALVLTTHGQTPILSFSLIFVWFFVVPMLFEIIRFDLFFGAEVAAVVRNVLLSFSVILFIYLLLVTFINKTVVTVTAKQLTTQQTPLPLFNHTRSHAMADIQTMRVNYEHMPGLYNFYYIRIRRIYGVQLITHEGRKHRLLYLFKDSATPTYILKQIQSFLAQYGG